VDGYVRVMCVLCACYVRVFKGRMRCEFYVDIYIYANVNMYQYISQVIRLLIKLVRINEMASHCTYISSRVYIWVCVYEFVTHG